MSEKTIKRILEIIPGACSWSIIIALIGILIISPVSAAVVLVVYLLYWACRFLYMTTLLVLATRRIARQRNTDWLRLCKNLQSDIAFQDIVHIVLYPIYKEPQQVLEDSLRSLTMVDYPLTNLIVVLAGEERDQAVSEKLTQVKNKFSHHFRDIITTIHPANIPGEIPSKGANATYAARHVQAYLRKAGYDIDRFVISCFDVDTCPEKQYFSCLTYHFLANPKRHQTSYQPFPVYSNNIYEAPAFARVIEFGSTFWQLMESMRYEKFITFSSHSMSFKTLVAVDYWPVDMISDDSVIFWKCYLKYNGAYQTYPLEVPVYMDIATGTNVWETMKIQYKQKRRWAWGVENFIYISMEFLKNKHIPTLVKLKKMYQLLDNHVNWATWAIIISFFTPFILLWGKMTANNALLFLNLSYVNSVISNALLGILFLCIIISKQFLPPRPRHVSRFIFVIFVLQWAFLPIVSALLGSFPALDAQTRMMTGNYLGFERTPKVRANGKKPT